MAVLSDKSMRELLESRILIIDPFDNESVQAASIDLRLGNHFLALEENTLEVIRLDEPVHYREFHSESITIPPHSFILATTLEYVALPDTVTGAVEGRSSIGRLGLFIQNAGWIDPGFRGTITLELYNANSLPIKLDARRRICQLVLYQMDNKVDRPYAGKYLEQRGTTGSRVFQDREITDTQSRST